MMESERVGKRESGMRDGGGAIMRRDQQTQPQILIVDDVPANLKVLRDALEPAGYDILAASNGEGALRIGEAARIRGRWR